MTDPFVAEIRAFAFNFPPRGWAFCNGQILPLSQNTALFSLLGTTYGGDGKSNFALPDLQGQGPIHHGQGPGLSDFFEGEVFGTETITLLESEMPNHTHRPVGSPDPADFAAPASDRALSRAQPGRPYQSDSTNNLVDLNVSAAAPAGGSQPHNNLPPILTLNFCIALQGVFPPRG